MNYYFKKNKCKGMRKKVGEYVMEELLGAGTYGEVYRGTKALEPDGQQFAIKMIAKKKMSEKTMSYLEREVDILQMVQHPNIVKLYDIKMTENHYYLIFEYCNGGDLTSLRKKLGGKVPEPLVRHILSQLVAGLNALYQKNTIHRDIKLSNIFLHYESEATKAAQKPLVKIGDFGFARLIEKTNSENGREEAAQPMSIVGTPLNMAPELLHKEAYSFKADIWSLGTIVYELLTGKSPFTGVCKDELVRNVETGLYWVEKTVGLSTECLDFINVCLQLRPAERIKWSDLMNHPFVVGTGSDRITPFDFGKFKARNMRSDHCLQSSTHFIFSSKIRYDFSSAPAETSLKRLDEQLSLESPRESRHSIRLQNSPEKSPTDDIFADYVKVDTNIKESSIGEGDFTSAKLEALTITDKYFY